MQKSNNFEIIENYSKIKDIFFAYFMSLKLFFKITVSSKKSYSNFFRDVISDNFLIDCSKQLSFKKMLNNFFNSANIEKLCIPTFEFSEGRTIIYEAKKRDLNVYGFQHGFMGDLHLNRFLSSFNLNSKDDKYKPNCVFLMGEIYKKYVEQFKIKSILIGNCRFKQLPPSFKKKEIKDLKYLILLDLHNWKEIINNVLDLKVKQNISIKPHPFTKHLIKNYLKDRKNSINQIDNIYEDSVNFDCILCSDSGVAIEYALSKWPVFILRNKNFINYSPLSLENKKIKSIILNDNGIKNISKKLKNRMFIESYIDNSYNFSKKHCYDIGLNAEKKFFLNF